MSGLLGEICHLFCCPPRPSHIVAKLAFLPPTPTYSIISCANDSKCSIEFKPEAGWHMSEDAASKLTVFYTVTKRQSRIVCMYVPANTAYIPFGCAAAANLSSNRSSRRGISPISLSSKSSQGMSASCPTLTDDGTLDSCQHPSSTGDTVLKTPYTVLFSHGNAVDIGQMAGFLQSLAHRFGVNILCYDYSGYGASSGQRLEENLYADAEAVLGELQQRFKVPLDQIVLYGQSIGTAPTVELATKYKVAGVVLHSPFMSGLRVVCPGTTRRFCFDPFTNIDKVSRILSPTLIIHGTDDEIIGIHHGQELYSRLQHPLEPAWIEGAGHNDIELFAEYAIRLDRFFTEDLGGSPARSSGLGRTSSPNQACVSPPGTHHTRQSFVRSAFSNKLRSSTSQTGSKKHHRHHHHHTTSGCSTRRPDQFEVTNGHHHHNSFTSGEISPRNLPTRSTPGFGDHAPLPRDATATTTLVTRSDRVCCSSRKDLIASTPVCRASTILETMSTTSESGEESSSCCSRSSGNAAVASHKKTDCDTTGSAVRRASLCRQEESVSRRQPTTVPYEVRNVHTTTTTATILPSQLLDTVD